MWDRNVAFLLCVFTAFYLSLFLPPESLDVHGPFVQEFMSYNMLYVNKYAFMRGHAERCFRNESIG